MSDTKGARADLESAREQVIRAMGQLRNCWCSVDAASRRGAPGNEADGVEESVNKAIAECVDILTSVQWTLDLPPEKWEEEAA